MFSLSFWKHCTGCKVATWRRGKIISSSSFCSSTCLSLIWFNWGLPDTEDFSLMQLIALSRAACYPQDSSAKTVPLTASLWRNAWPSLPPGKDVSHDGATQSVQGSEAPCRTLSKRATPLPSCSTTLERLPTNLSTTQSSSLAPGSIWWASG